MMKEAIFVPIERLEGYPLQAELKLTIQKTLVVPYTGSTILFATNELGRPVVVKIPTQKSKAEKEWLGTVKAFKASVPTPIPIALATNQNNQLGIVTGRIVGNKLYHYPDGQLRHQLGQTVRKMHQQVAVEGTDWVNKGRANYTYFDKLIYSWLQSQLDEVGSKGGAQKLLKQLSDSMQIHCASVRPAFNHNDIHDGQVIVEGQRITLIDFEEWLEESPLNDVALYLFHSIRTGAADNQFWHFLNGYLDKNVLSEVEKNALMFYLLFISCRALHYFYSRGDKYFNEATKTHQKVTNYVESERFWKEL